MCENLAYFALHFFKHVYAYMFCPLTLNMKIKSFRRHIFYLGIILGSLIIFNSCAPVKNVVYFQNLQKDTTLHNIVNNNFELKIRQNDLLGINIISPDPLSTPLFNGVQGTSTASSVGNTSGASSGGFLVDKKGNITVYKLGTIHVEGLTRAELKYRLEKDLAPYLKDAVVTIRFLSNRITLLGEVAKPGVVTMPNEQISLLEAIALSGDLTFTGRRDNILVIRETEAGKQFKRLNLSDNSIFYSPFYYLKPDDVVYVEPTKAKIKNGNQNQQIFGFILSGLSIFITILAYLRR
jgi:Periplasmic protein involved in polysaccharide export